MSNNNSEKSIESASIENMPTSQNTHNKLQNLQKKKDIKNETKEENNILDHNSDDKELIKNKITMSRNDFDLPLRNHLNSNEIISSDKKKSLAFSLSPIKRGVKKRNMLVDIMEKSKKINSPRKSVICFQEFQTKEENPKKERKDVYGIPINRRNRKKIKVTFSDTINNNNKNVKNQLAEIIPIASYKKYNYIEGIQREEELINYKSTCQCCLIN